MVRIIQNIIQSRWSKLAVGTIILAFFSYTITVNWQQLQQYEWQIKPIYLGLAFVCYPVNLGLAMVNWHLLIVGTGGSVGFRDNAKIFCYSNFPKNIPGAVWYVMGRTYMYQKRGIDPMTVILATALELLFLILSGITIYILMYPFITSMYSSFYMWLLALAILPLLIAPVFNKLLLITQVKKHKLKDVYFSQKSVFIILTNYIIAWVWGGFILYLLINSITQIPISKLLNIIFAWAISGVASLSTAFIVNGMGVKEVSLSLLLSEHSVLSISIIVSILFKLLIILGDTFWSGIMILILLTRWIR